MQKPPYNSYDLAYEPDRQGHELEDPIVGNLAEHSSESADLHESVEQKDWYQRMLDISSLEDAGDLTILKSMHEVTKDFIFVAKLYAEVIVSEKHLPIEEKTIKPSSSHAGVAGGVKFVAGGILFKFSEDHRFPNGTYLYGGGQPDVEAAAKACGQERKSLEQVIKTRHLHGIIAPLMTTIDYRGERLSCQMLIPGISNEQSLVFGSTDAGLTIRVPDENSSILGPIRELSKVLFLAPHAVLERSSGRVMTIPMAADCEIHLVNDRLHIIDSARLLPPMAPIRKSRDVFSRLFRPEFLAWYGQALSSDAFSAFAAPHDSKAQNDIVIEATQALLKKRVSLQLR